jgi:hypothetical protein
MIAVKAEGDATGAIDAARWRRNLAWVGMGTLALVAAVSVYVVADRNLNSENRALVRDLPVIERIDQYSNIESVEFLQQLQKEGLFAAEVDDGG